MLYNSEQHICRQTSHVLAQFHYVYFDYHDQQNIRTTHLFTTTKHLFGEEN